MDVSAAADELYGIPPEQFIARRTELAGQARADGDAEAREQIAALRKPTVAAWAVNLVVRERGDEVQDLLSIAEELRAAQRGLAADRMRALSDQRRAAITSLTRAAREITKTAGRPIPDGVLREVQASFDAAVADENAERALRTGRLTTALSYSGFGEVDISEAVAALDARPRLAVIRGDKAEPKAVRRAPDRAEPDEPPARESFMSRAAARREQALAQATQQLDDVIGRRDELLAEAERLRRRMADIDRELKPAEAAVRAAQRKVDAASH
jgi:hypothetical protein